MRISYNGVEKDFDCYFNEIKRVLTSDEFKDCIINKISFATSKGYYGGEVFLKLYTDFDCASGNRITVINYYYKTYVINGYYDIKNVEAMNSRIKLFYDDINKLTEYIKNNYNNIIIDTTNVGIYKPVKQYDNYGYYYHITEDFN